MSRLKHVSNGRMVWLVALLVFLLSGITAAGTSASIPRWAVTSGGGSSSGGVYALNATIGQAAGGVSSGGPFVLRAGYVGPASGNETLYLPMVLRG